jgi:AmmeMemoRadiSam system protein A
MSSSYTDQEKKLLLKIARDSIKYILEGKSLNIQDNYTIPDHLFEYRATFVTLTKFGKLRGCIGALEPSMPLVEDIRVHAIAAATQDYRFNPLALDELPDNQIEISVIKPIGQINFGSPDELLQKITPYEDGIIIEDGRNRATFLPQVWEKIPNKEQFLSSLCLKLGASPDLWRAGKIFVYRYNVEKLIE